MWLATCEAGRASSDARTRHQGRLRPHRAAFCPQRPGFLAIGLLQPGRNAHLAVTVVAKIANITCLSSAYLLNNNQITRVQQSRSQHKLLKLHTPITQQPIIQAEAPLIQASQTSQPQHVYEMTARSHLASRICEHK